MFLEAYRLYTVSKHVLQLKGNFKKFLGELLFETCHARVRFLDRTQKFLLLYLKRFHHRRSPTNFKSLKTNKGNICSGVSFRVVIGGWIERLEFFKRNAAKDIFLIIF